MSGGRAGDVAPLRLGGDAASVFYVDSYLPIYFEVRATINAAKPLAGWKANAYLIFDYVSPTDFKFAGVNISTNKIEMGHRTAAGWIVDEQAPAQVKPDTDYNLLLSVNGLTATLVIDNMQLFSHVFAPTIDADGVARGLNRGMVGLGSNNSSARIDNTRGADPAAADHARAHRRFRRRRRKSIYRSAGRKFCCDGRPLRGDAGGHRPDRTRHD